MQTSLSKTTKFNQILTDILSPCVCV